MKKSQAPSKLRIQAPQTQTVVDLTALEAQAQQPPPKKQKIQGKWTLDAKNLYLTYPQCHTKKEEVLQNVIKKFGEELKWIVICEEEHLDGSPHLHLSMALNGRYYSRIPTDLDILVESSSHPQGKHGNYQATRGIKKNLGYVTKKGKYITHGDIDLKAVLEKKGSVYQPVVEEILGGKTPTDILKMYPLEFFLKRKEIEGFHQAVLQLKGEQEKPKLRSVNLVGQPNATLISLLTWLRENLLMIDLKKRKPRQKHLYLCGPPGIGKSHLLNQLRDKLRVYDVPAETWNDAYADGIYDLIVFDEFQGQKPIGQLNSLTDGFPTPLVRRGTHPYLKQDKLPVVICSNKLPHDVYNKTTDRAYVDAFASRYLILDFYEANFYGKIDMVFESLSPEAVLLDSDEESEGNRSALATGSEATSPPKTTKYCTFNLMEFSD